MKKKITLLLTVLLTMSVCLQAQQISVKSFKRLENDLSARTSGVMDQNGEIPAIIKMVSTENDFFFEGDGNGIVKTEPKMGEYWIYVPHDSRFITVRHPKLGMLRNYQYPDRIEAGMVYEMELTGGKVTTMVEEEMGGQYFLLRVNPPDAMVFIDNVYETTQNGMVSKLLAYGKHTFRVESKPWYQSESGNIEVAGDDKIEKTVNLKEAFGHLNITSNPSGASISIDGENVGKTPFKSDRLLEGTHTVRASFPLYYTDDQFVNVEAGVTQPVNIVLKPNFGTLQITSSPESGADVYIDGVKVGKTPYKNDKQKSGTYRIRVEKALFAPAEDAVTVTDEEVVVKNLTMTATMGTLRIEAEKGVSIWVDGEEKGQGKWEGRLFKGYHAIEARKESHRTISRTIEVKSGETHVETIEPLTPIYGKLNINSNPPDATIRLNKKDYGTTPNIIPNLLIGSYTLELIKPGYQVERRTINIEEGKIATLQVALSEEGEKTKKTPGGKVVVTKQYQGQDRVEAETSALNSENVPNETASKTEAATQSAPESAKKKSAKNVSESKSKNKTGAFFEGLFNKKSSGNISEEKEMNPVPKKNYEETVYGLKMKMVYVEGGSFIMGCTGEQGADCYEDEQNTRRVHLDGYYIGVFEVTQDEWQKVMGGSIEQQMKKAGQSALKGSGENYPMYYVSWAEANAFCESLSRGSGKKYALPTEAQWEYAARGGNKSSGTKYSGSNDISEVGYTKESKVVQTSAMGNKKPNELEIFDMSGNVSEWCEDWYEKAYSTTDMENPKGPEKGTQRVYRGGAYTNAAKGARVSMRFKAAPDFRANNLGFRVVMIPE